MCLQISVCVCVCRIGKPVSAERHCTAMCSLSDLKRPSRASIYVLLWLLPIHSLKWHFPKRLSSNALNPASSWAKSDTHPCKRIFIGGYKSMSFTELLFPQINSNCFFKQKSAATHLLYCFSRATVSWSKGPRLWMMTSPSVPTSIWRMESSSEFSFKLLAVY